MKNLRKTINPHNFSMVYLGIPVTLLVTHIRFIVTWILFDGDSRFCKKNPKILNLDLWV
jgi:hypothetical protein